MRKRTNKTKPEPSKKATNATKAKQMAETDFSTQTQGLDRARDAIHRLVLGKEIVNLCTLKLDRNLAFEIEKEKAFIVRESTRIHAHEESRTRVTTEILQNDGGTLPEKLAAEFQSFACAGTQHGAGVRPADDQPRSRAREAGDHTQA